MDLSMFPSLDSWRAMKPPMRRAVASRLAGTRDSAAVDRVVAHVNELATGRATGATVESRLGYGVAGFALGAIAMHAAHAFGLLGMR